MPAHEHLQQQLFDPDQMLADPARTSARKQQQLFNPASTRARRPGETSFSQWLQRPDVSYHGTFNPDWESAPYAHFGDLTAATQRLGHVSHVLRSSGEGKRQAYYSGESAPEDAYDDYGDDEGEVATHTGRVFARRLDLAKQNRQLSDPIANAAQMHAMLQEGHEPWEIPSSVSESSEGRVEPGWEDEPHVKGPNWGFGTEREERRIKAGSRLLQMGKGLSYSNVAEQGETGVSHVVPRGGHTAWEHDVVTDPHAHPAVKEYAQGRIKRGEASAVPFSEGTFRGEEKNRGEQRPSSEQMTFGSMGKAGVHDLGTKGYGVRSYAPWRHLSDVQFTSHIGPQGEDVTSTSRGRPV